MVWPRWSAWQLAALVLAAASVVFVVGHSVTATAPHSFSQLGQLVFWIVYCGFFACPRPLRLYENGIWYARDNIPTRAVFVAWQQLDRYHFEGDVLILTGTESTLKGGPVQGGVFRLREDGRVRAGPILARYLPPKSNAG